MSKCSSRQQCTCTSEHDATDTNWSRSTPIFDRIIDSRGRLRVLTNCSSRGQTAALLKNVGNVITRLSMDRFGRNWGGRILSHPRGPGGPGGPTCPSWWGVHGNGDCLATVHWTFSSYGRQKSERVNQFWWKFVHNIKLGTNNNNNNINNNNNNNTTTYKAP